MPGIDQIRPLITNIGKAGVHALFPNDFEYYAVTLELTDSQGSTIDYLTFPVSPSMISYDDSKITNIKKTMGGVTALDIEGDIPKKISLSGMFGRKLRILLGPGTESESESTANGVYDNVVQGGLQVKTSLFNARLKTGYGTTKVLEAIHKKSSGLDKYNRPHRLFLYIPPLGHNFLVKTNQLQLNQDYSSSNMLWKYTISLTTLASIENIKDAGSVASSLLKSTGIDILQKQASGAVNKIKNAIF